MKKIDWSKVFIYFWLGVLTFIVVVTYMALRNLMLPMG